MIGRLLYAALFCLALPALLALWCRAAEPMLSHWPILSPAWLGWPISGLGATLILAGWSALWFRGGGLPMNAFPPKRRVETGVFALVDHPIYLGAVLLCAGLGVGFQSRAALWLGTPTLALGCAALVWGYEASRTRALLGPRQGEPLLRLPPDAPERARAWDRVSALLLMYAPWAVLYEAVGHVPVPGGLDAHFAFENAWPILEWTVTAYTSGYLLGVAPAFIARSRADLRWLMTLGWFATAVGMLCYLTLPLLAPPRGDPAGFFGPWLSLERADGLAGRAAVPSFHVFWACLGAWALARRWPSLALAWWLWASAVCVSCITTGMHALVDVPAGIALLVLALRADRVWSLARRLAEQTANTWREWRLGPVRVLLHAPLAFIAASCGVVVISVLSPETPRTAVWVLALSGLLGAAAWGQIVEYSGRLARPFGYYGHALGSASALVGCSLAGWSGWTFAAALCTAGPLVQAIGRVRCLVNGCCHGHACSPGLGIVVTEPRSRVIRLANLGSVPIHATQAYSILANLVIFALLLRLWSAGAPAPLALGLYLMLSGLARFVEEHYRGEPQTPIFGGLHSYQWLSLVSVLAGCAVAVVPGAGLAWPELIRPGVWTDAIGLGTVYALAMGVDFPNSSRRFARLA